VFDIAGWTLMFLLPSALALSINRDPNLDPALLFLQLGTWTAVPVNLGFLFNRIRGKTAWLLLPVFLCAAAMSALASACYWAFFVQSRMTGWVTLGVIAVPAVVYLAYLFVRKCKEGRA
jgi:hypothetical protein